jgi:hypothetical protein
MTKERLGWHENNWTQKKKGWKERLGLGGKAGLARVDWEERLGW